MSASPAEQTLPTGAQRRTIIGTLLVGAFVFSLNSRGTVLESTVIVEAFALDRYKVQWITGAEAMASLTALFSSVYLMKLFGTRRVFLLGAVFLTAGGLGEAMARTPWELGGTGVVRACAAFYTFPGLTILQRLLPGRTRFTYCTYLTLVYGGQVVVEPIGALLAFNPSWRALFGGLGVCGACLVLIALCLFPDDRPERRPEHGFDFTGAGLFMVTLGLILFLLYRGNYLGWRVSTPIWTAAAAVLAALALFIWRELVAAEPFLNLGAFAFRTVALSMLASAFWCAALYGVAVQLPNCLLVLGYEHWKTGLVILPMGLIVLAVMFLGGFVRPRGRLVWLFRVGLAGMTVVELWLARIDIYTPWQWVMGVTSLWAVFAGVCLSPIAQLTFEGIPPELVGPTSAMKFFMRSFNGTVGILLAGVLIDQGTWWGLEFVRDSVVHGQGAGQADVPAIRDHLARHGSAPPAAATQAQAVLDGWVNLHAQVIGYRTGLRGCAYLSAAGLVVSLFIHRRKEFSVFDAG
ncbi:MAG: transporter [Gemmataceae bacterium]|nr:transporter [Gemmataceae bacterium]